MTLGISNRLMMIYMLKAFIPVNLDKTKATGKRMQAVEKPSNRNVRRVLPPLLNTK